MSKYSGKCDVFDWLEIAKEENETAYECFVRRHMTLCPNGALESGLEPIEIKKPSDLVMYYPYVAAAMACNSDSGDNIFLSSRPYPCIYLDIGCPDSYAYYTKLLMDEYERVKKEEDPKYV